MQRNKFLENFSKNNKTKNKKRQNIINIKITKVTFWGNFYLIKRVTNKNEMKPRKYITNLKYIILEKNI